ncbi:MAG: hypothetical protein R2795_20035 [Saprospiraceae bacterium]
MRVRLILGLLVVTNVVIHAQNLHAWAIQGSTTVSPYNGQWVSLAPCVVTAVKNDYFFMQTPTANSDNDPATSDGIMVITDAPPGVVVGQLVQIDGTVVEYDGQTALQNPDLSIEVVAGAAALPEAVVLEANFPSPSAFTMPDLEKVEGMRVSFSAFVAGPTEGYREMAAAYVSEERPFREPGVQWPGSIAGAPVWDGNPELFWFDPDGLHQPNNRFISAGQLVQATAVMFQEEDLYIALPLQYSVSGTRTEYEVRWPAADEFTIGSLNALYLKDNDLYEVKLEKTARYIVDKLKTPDVLALQEVGSLSVLSDLRFRISQLAPSVDYEAFLFQGNNDTDLNNGFLVSRVLQNPGCAHVGQYGRIEHRRKTARSTPLLLEAELPTMPPTPLQVINVHLRSLNGITGADAFLCEERSATSKHSRWLP